MSRIEKQDTQGTKPLLSTGELGYDNYPAGGDVGRVYVGTGAENVAIAKKSEVTVLDNKANAHIARVDNPHSVTKAQVGLGNVDNTADVDKSVLSATKLTTPRSITISGEVAGSVSFDGSADINISATIQPNSVALGVDTTGNYVSSVVAGAGVTVTGVVGEGWTPSIAIAPVGTSGTYTKVSTNDKGQVVSGEPLTANDIPNLDASKITSGIIDAARLPSYVDDVLEYANLSAFPAVGETGKIYVALDTNKAYRWSGSTYVYITSGAVDSVAGKTGVVTLVKADVGLANVDNTSDANKPISTATQTALNTKVDTTTNQTIAGIKTFSSSPIVPVPTTDFQSVPLKSTNITVDVGSGQPYTTINQALEYLSGFYPMYKKSEITATINLKAGFVMAEQVLVSGIDLGWITIVGEDAETIITTTALTTAFNGTNYPAFVVDKGGTSPIIGQLFRFNVEKVGGNKHGLMTVGAGSSANISPNKGFIGAGTFGIYAESCSAISANSANCSNAGHSGISATNASVISANSANCSNAGTYGIAANRGSTVNAVSANCSNAGHNGIYAVRGSTVNAVSALVKDQTSGGARIHVSTGSTISAHGIDTTGGTSPVFNQTKNTLTSEGIIYQ